LRFFRIPCRLPLITAWCKMDVLHQVFFLTAQQVRANSMEDPSCRMRLLPYPAYQKTRNHDSKGFA
jgi:hypothetical protein